MKRWRLLEKKRNNELIPQLLTAYLEISENWEYYSGDCDDQFCSFCSEWDQWDKEHDVNCIVLRAYRYINKHKL
jgi:hypothetical protein